MKVWRVKFLGMDESEQSVEWVGSHGAAVRLQEEAGGSATISEIEIPKVKREMLDFLTTWIWR